MKGRHESRGARLQQMIPAPKVGVDYLLRKGFLEYHDGMVSPTEAGLDLIEQMQRDGLLTPSDRGVPPKYTAKAHDVLGVLLYLVAVYSHAASDPKVLA